MLKVNVSSIYEEIFNGELDKLTISTLDGEITILPQHIPLISVIKNGYVYLNGEKIIIESGTINVIDDKVQILIAWIK